MRFFSSLFIVQVLAGATMLPYVADAKSNPPPGPMPKPGRYITVALHNAKASALVVGIVPEAKSTRSYQAAAIARFAAIQMGLTRHKRRAQVYVFADKATGQAFGRYQRRRGSAPLTQRDFVALQKLWPRTLARYEFANGRERVLYPSRAPQSWWKSESTWPKR